jgi:hypothetical protein
MIFQDYEPLARVTLKELPLPQHLLHMGLGVIGEWGELVDAIKKSAIYGKPLDTVNLTEEVGDVTWYMAGYCKELLVHPAVLQTSLDVGIKQGIQAKEQMTTIFDSASLLMAMAAAASSHAMRLVEVTQPGDPKATQSLSALATVLGIICGALDVDPADAMDRNIAKLKQRYGDKFSVHAALNRNLDAERAVLEGGAGTH